MIKADCGRRLHRFSTAEDVVQAAEDRERVGDATALREGGEGGVASRLGPRARRGRPIPARMEDEPEGRRKVERAAPDRCGSWSWCQPRRGCRPTLCPPTAKLVKSVCDCVVEPLAFSEGYPPDAPTLAQVERARKSP